MLHIKGPILKVLELFKVVAIVAHGDILKLVALMLTVSKLLAMAKDTGGLYPITIGEPFF
jgi:hypothetical protein